MQDGGKGREACPWAYGGLPCSLCRVEGRDLVCSSSARGMQYPQYLNGQHLKNVRAYQPLKRVMQGKKELCVRHSHSMRAPAYQSALAAKHRSP